jgi:glycine dehydrogenase subunit 1
MVTAATIHMSMLGAEGLRRVASSCCLRTRQLVEALTRLDGIEAVFDEPNFHEAVLRLDRPVASVLKALAHRGIFGGYDLSGHYPELGNALLVCATETKTESDIQTCADAFRAVMADAQVA